MSLPMIIAHVFYHAAMSWAKAVELVTIYLIPTFGAIVSFTFRQLAHIPQVHHNFGVLLDAQPDVAQIRRYIKWQRDAQF